MTLILKPPEKVYLHAFTTHSGMGGDAGEYEDLEELGMILWNIERHSPDDLEYLLASNPPNE